MPRSSRFAATSLALALLAPALGGLALAGPPPASDPARFVVGYHALPRDLDAGDDWNGASVLRVDRALHHAVVLADDETELRAQASEDANVRFVEKDAKMRLFFTPNDPRWGSQYGPQHVRAPQAWDVSRGEASSGIELCFVDSGARSTHEDLAGPRYLGGYDFVRNDGTPNDENGHGTHVAGTAAGSTNNAKGIAGIAQVGYWIAKSFGPEGTGYVSDIADGIRWCADRDADVLSMSFGGSYSSTINDAVSYAYDSGVLPVAAAGNDGPCSNCVSHPATMASVIAVSCTGSAQSQCSFSSDGNEIDLAAPGDDILAPYSGSDSDYRELQGTSMSTPHVSGVAALLWSKFPYLTRGEVRDLLEDNAKDLGASGWDPLYGWGLVDAEKAFNAVLPPPVEERVYFEDFDDGVAQGWTSTGLWHVDSKCTTPPSSPSYLGFQEDGSCDYNANLLGAVRGTATLGLDLTGMVGATLKVQHRFEVESSSSAVDVMKIEASGDGGSSWTTLAQWDARNGAQAWGGHTVSIKEFISASTRVRFSFDSVDAFSNAHPGWFLDNVEVLAADNYPPLARAGPDRAGSDPDGDGTGTVTLDGTGSSDSDGVIASFEWLEGGTLVATGASPTASLAVGTHTLTLRATDDDGDASTDTVVATISANVAPVARAGADASAGDPDGDGYATVSLDGGASADADGAIASFEWLESGALVATGAAPAPSLAVGAHSLTLRVTDNGGVTATDTVVATVTANREPTAAFTYSCDALDCTFNSGTSSDPDGAIVARAWDFGDGGAATGATVSHAFAAAGTYTVALTVTDDGGATGSASRSFDPTAPPGVTHTFDAGSAPGWTLGGLWHVTQLCATPPSAPKYLGYHRAAACDFNAGARTTGSATFNADLTAAPSSTLSFAHRFQVQSSSSAVDVMRVEASTNDGGTWTTLQQWDARNAAQTTWQTYSVPLDAYVGSVVKVRFFFDSVNSFSNAYAGWLVDDVAVTNAFDVNHAPTARAGSDVALKDADGTGSETASVDAGASGDDDGTIVLYEWLEGGNVIATGATASLALAVGAHSITLRVTDDDGATATDTLVATVAANVAPVARAGSDQSKRDSDGSLTETFSVSGAASTDADGTLATVEWLEGGTLLASGSAASLALGVGAHSITLRVADNGGAVATDTLVLTVQPNLAPAASAGPDVTVDDFDGDGGEPVALDGRASSDADGALVTYEWLEGATLLATGATPTPRIADGVHAITLRVTDNGGATATDTLVVTVNTNRPPVASFSWSCIGTTCTFSSSCSSDPEGPILAFAWQFGDGETATGASATHVYASAGTFTARLTVVDAAGATDDAASAVTAHAASVLGPESPPASPEVTDNGQDTLGDRVPAPHVNVQSAWIKSDGARTYLGVKIGDALPASQAMWGAAYELAFQPTWSVADRSWGGAVPAGFTLLRIRALAVTSPVQVEQDGTPGVTYETSTRFHLRAYSTMGTQFRDNPLAEVTGTIDASRDVVWWVIPHATLQHPHPGSLLKLPQAKAGLGAGPGASLLQYQAVSDFTPAGRDYRYPGGCAASGAVGEGDAAGNVDVREPPRPAAVEGAAWRRRFEA